MSFSDLELYFFGWVGVVGWWLEKVKLKITSTKVEVEVEAELGNMSPRNFGVLSNLLGLRTLLCSVEGKRTHTLQGVITKLFLSKVFDSRNIETHDIFFNYMKGLEPYISEAKNYL